MAFVATLFKPALRLPLALGAIGLLASAIYGWEQYAVKRDSVQRGERLFEARPLVPGEGISGRMVDHAEDLPAMATRCSNCHQVGLAPQVAATAVDPGSKAETPKSFGPRLGREHVASLKARRGGPPSQFDAASLCLLLRKGLDPASVMVDQTMPRYKITDAQCVDLWNFLISTP